MATIKTNQNTEVTVDDEVFERLSKFTWADNGETISTRHFHGDFERTLSMASVVMNTNRRFMYDHVDRNHRNNCKSNLRVASVSQNAANRVKSVGTSAYKGVYFNKQMSKWMARVKKNGKTFYLGLFSDEKDAASAYNSKAHELFGEFAVLNKL